MDPGICLFVCLAGVYARVYYLFAGICIIKKKNNNRNKEIMYYKWI